MPTQMTSRGLASLAAAMALVAIAGACGESTSSTNTLSDQSPPSVALSKGGTSVDTVIAFQVDAKDNLGLKTISINITGGLDFSFDSTFTSAHTDASIPFSVPAPRSIPKGTPVLGTAQAAAGTLNPSAGDARRPRN